MSESEFRLTYQACGDALRRRLSAAAPSRIQILAGPRQIGKTTLLLELKGRFERNAIYAAADGPEAALPGFWERLWSEAEDLARTKGKAVVLLDEVQQIHGWSAKLKAEWDRLRRKRLTVHVVATGSSALRLGAGSRESLAGRFERLTLSHWSASALADAFHLKPSDAAAVVVAMGSYPGAFEFRDDLARWTAYVRDAILEPALGRDILALASVRRPALLRQVFALCASSPAQIVSLNKMHGQLHDSGALETVAQYLRLLEEAFLIAPLEKYSPRPARRRAAPPKLVTLNNALLAATDPRGIPDAASDPSRFGAWLENACLSFAWNSSQRVTYWREEPFEVDGIIEGAWGRWAIEVKSGRFDASDLKGLAEFTRRHPTFRPLVICEAGEERVAERLGIAAIPWRRYLLDGPTALRSGTSGAR